MKLFFSKVFLKLFIRQSIFIHIFLLTFAFPLSVFVEIFSRKLCVAMDNFFIEKAKNELRETESRKSQSLEQFRAWINKHPFLSNVRQGK
jgi:hypothetical protein